MKRISTVLLGICSGVFVLGMIPTGGADDTSHSEAYPARKMPPIAGRPYMEVQEVVDRHHDRLMQVPNVYIVAVGGKGILVGAYVYADSQGRKPTTLPTALQALPAAIEGIPVDIHPLYLMRPPDGFIVLKPGKVREQAESCPKGFKIVDGYGGWRFCVDRKNPEKIPDLWSLPIAGIPYETVQEIHKRHKEDLLRLPGVEEVSLGVDGIYVSTKQPEVVPPEVEGVPIIIRAPHGQTIRSSAHTLGGLPTRPFRGGIGIRQSLQHQKKEDVYAASRMCIGDYNDDLPGAAL